MTLAQPADAVRVDLHHEEVGLRAGRPDHYQPPPAGSDNRDGRWKEVTNVAKKGSGSSGGSKSSGGNYRSAKTGRYVTEKYGKSHKSTTVKESK